MSDTPEVEVVANEQQEDASFDAVFDTTEPTPTPEQPEAEPPVEEPAPVVEPEPEPEQPKPFSREEFESALAALKSESKAHVDRLGGTVGGLKQTLEALRSQTQTGQPVDVTIDDLPSDLREEYPELADKMLRAMQGMAKKMRGTAPTSEPAPPVTAPAPAFDMNQVEQVVQQRVAEIEQKFEMKTVALKHKDWKQITGGSEYRTWLGSQPAEYQQTVGNSWDSDVVIGSIDKFKESQKKAPTPAPSARKDLLKAAVTPRGTGGREPSAPNTEDDGFASAFT